VSGWRSLAYRLVRPLLFAFEPERIHRLTISGLRVAGANPIGRWLLQLLGGAPRRPAAADVLGLTFRNRVGIGAGFDKDARAVRGWASLGLGFAEVGTVTPVAQPGNDRPRLFRLVEDEALINRMGFNNAGSVDVARNVMLVRRRLPSGFMVGVNIGRGAATDPEQAADDYVEAYRLVAPVADYVAVNVSSPNTPGLRDLQDTDRLRGLLHTLRETGQRLNADPPLLVKLAPDLAPETFDGLVELIAAEGAGLILGNTSVGRDGLRSMHAHETGGLSGKPLRDRMLAAVARARDLAPSTPIVASGGIDSAADVAAAYRAGADLVQLWTGLVYRGPGLIGAAVAVPRDTP
jgi:dihydroorotate dehydrogenase